VKVLVPFYRANGLEQIAINLFYGWGYNFYRLENQLRMDDLLIRSKVSELLSQARSDVVNAELAYRREHLPPPTRDNPFPDAQAVKTAKAIQAAADAISAVEGVIRHAPAPENDRMWQRYRSEADTLMRLGQADTQMVGIAAALSKETREGGSTWIMEHRADNVGAAEELRNTMRLRGELLTV
jgi:hypothetical protein